MNDVKTLCGMENVMMEHTPLRSYNNGWPSPLSIVRDAPLSLKDNASGSNEQMLQNANPYLEKVLGNFHAVVMKGT